MNNITLIYNIYKFYNYTTYVYAGYQIYYYGNKTYIYLFPKNKKTTELILESRSDWQSISDNWVICNNISTELEDDYDA